MKKILILSADFGYGHRSAANATAAGLRAVFGPACSVDVVNPLDDPRAPALLREDQRAYDRMVREAPDLYRFGYRVCETWVAAHLVEGSFTLGLFNVLRDLLRQRQPDIVVTTYLFYQGILSAIFAAEGYRLPVVTIVTDLGDVPKMWFHSVADLCLVPTRAVYEKALAVGMPSEKVKVTGLPVRLDIAGECREPAALRAEMGWRADQFTVLAIGSRRVDRLEEALQTLNHSGWPLQLIAVAGGDSTLLQHLQSTRWHVNTHVYGFVEQMGTFLCAADCVLSKAGGLTVAESLACGRPLILVDVIQGQETGNADYVVGGGAGVLAQTPQAVLESVSHWLENDRQLFLQYAKRASHLGRPRAALEAAELIWAAG